jgi:hypothetical protein
MGQYNDPVLDEALAPPTQSAIDVSSLIDTINRSGDNTNKILDAGAAARNQINDGYAASRTSNADGAEFAINVRTGEVMDATGRKFKMNAPTMVHLATAATEDGTPLPKMTQAPKGWDLLTQHKLASDIDNIPTESDFWGSLGASFKTGLGQGWSAIKSMTSDEDPNNAWSDAQTEHASNQTIGQFKAGTQPWYSGYHAFITGLGQTAGYVGSSVAMAAPATLAGAAAGTAAEPGAGTAAGAISTGAYAVTGGLQSWGMQAGEFYTNAVDAMHKMSSAELEALPGYQNAVTANPGASKEQLIKGIAADGARAAGAAGSVPGAVEAIFGRKLAGNFLAKLSFAKAAGSKLLPGAASEGASDAPGFLSMRGLANNTTRAVGGAIGAGGLMVAQQDLGQSAGAARTGIGSSSLADNLDLSVGVPATQAGALFGFFGGAPHGNKAPTPEADPNNKIPGAAGADMAAAMGGGNTDLPRDRVLRNVPGVNNDVQRDLPLDNPRQPPPPGAPPGGPQGDLFGGGGHTPTPEAPAGPDPNQGDLFGPQQGNLDLRAPAPPPGPDPRVQGMQALLQITGLHSPQEIQQHLPDIVRASLEHPQLAMALRAAGLDTAQLTHTPELGPEPPPPAPPAQLTHAPELGPGPQDSPQAHAMAAVLQITGLHSPEEVIANLRDVVQAAREHPQTPLMQALADSGLLDQVHDPAAAAAADQFNQAPPGRFGQREDVLDGGPQPLPARPPQLGPSVRRPLTAKGGDASTLGPAAPEPPQAPADRTPDGRPVGVSPPPVTNPVPMTAGEAQGRAQAQAARGQAPIAVDAPAPAPAALPTNPRAAEAAAAKAAREKSAPAATPVTPKGEKAVGAKGQAAIDKAKAKETAKSGVTETPAKAVPVSKKAQAVIDKAKAAEEEKKKSGETQPPSAEPAAPPAEATAPVSKPIVDEEPADPEPEVEKHEALQQVAKVEGPSKAAPAVDLTTPARVTPAKIPLGANEHLTIPDTLKVETGEGHSGDPVDLRVQVPNEALRQQLKDALKRTTLTAGDRETISSTLTKLDQLHTLLDVHEERAVEELLKRVDQSAEGRSLVSAQDAIDLRQEIADRRAEREAAGKDNRGRPIGRPTVSLLIRLPLLAEEVLHFARLMRDQARAELARGVEPARSVARRMIALFSPHMANEETWPGQMHAVLRSVAEFTDEHLDQMARSAINSIKDSPLAKQVMRGASEVAHAMPMRDNEERAKLPRSGPKPEEQPAPKPPLAPKTAAEMGLVERNGARTVSYKGAGDLPREAVKLVEGWLQMLERGGTKLSGPLHVMSMQHAREMYPEAFPRDTDGHYAQVMVDGKLRHVVAVDWEGIAGHGINNDPIAIEALAHEVGHYAEHEIFNRSDRGTQEEVIRAYNAWLSAHGHLSPTEMFRSHATHLMKAAAGNPFMDASYAGHFSEWLANHVARHLLTEQEPRSLVEKYFARVGDFLRKMWSGITGKDMADPAVRNMLNRFQSKAAMKNASPYEMMPHEPEGHALDWLGKRDEEGNREIPGAKAAKAILNRATADLAPSKTMLGDILTGNWDKARASGMEAVKNVSRTIMESPAGDSLRRVGLKLATMDQIVALYKGTPLGEPLRRWVDLERRASQLVTVVLYGGKSEAVLDADGTPHQFPGVANAIERARNLTPKVREMLMTVMAKATRYGIVLDQAFDGPGNMHLQTGLGDLAVLRNRQRYAELQTLWQGLVDKDATAADIYTKLRDGFVELHTKEIEAKQKNLLDKGAELGLTDAVIERAMNRLKQASLELVKGDYFPLMREGRWIVSAHLPGVSESFNTRAEADQRARDLKALNPGARIQIDEPVKGDYALNMQRRMVQFFDSSGAARDAREHMLKALQEEYEVNDLDMEKEARALHDEAHPDGDVPFNLLDTLIGQPFSKDDHYNMLEQSDKQFIQEFTAQLKAKGAIDPVVQQALIDAQLEASPELSPRRSLLPRENVLGADRDMLKAYAIRIHGRAHMYSRIVHSPESKKAWQQMYDTKETFEPTTAVLNNIQEQQDAIAAMMRPTAWNRAQNVMTDLSSMAFLAFSPGYILANALQPHMITTPVLGGMRNAKGDLIGVAKAAKYVQDAYKGAVPYFSKRGLQDFTNEIKRLQGEKVEGHDTHWLAEEMIRKFGASEGEQQMLRTMLETGRLDFSFLNTIQDAMRGGKAQRLFTGVARLGMAFAQQTEAMNRVVTALATYRMALGELKGRGGEAMGHDEASHLASSVIGETQLDYSKFNRPVVFNKSFLRVALQFKVFTQGMYALFVKNAALALNGDSPEERQEGRRTLMYLMGTHGAAAGVSGMGPFAVAAKLGVGLIAATIAGGGAKQQGDDKKWKTGDEKFHEDARSVFGDTVGNVVERGLPALFGVDIADRVGWPSLADSRYVGVKAGDNAGSALDKWVISMAGGAPYSNIRRIVTGAGNAFDGNPYTHASDALPGGIRSVVNAFRASTTGLLDQHGNTIVPASEMGWGDVGLKVLGLTPAVEQQAQQQRSERIGTTARIQQERGTLLKQYGAAQGADRDAVKAAIDDFNQSVPTGFQIRGSALSATVQSRAKDAAGIESRQEREVKRFLHQE